MTTESSLPVFSQSQPRFARKRAIQACQLCRARRIKCDNQKPKCTACRRSQAECIFSPDGDTVDVNPGIQKVLQRIDDLENILRTLQPNNSVVSLSLDNTQDEQRQQFSVTVEEILTWTVFEGRYNDRSDLKVLLHENSSSVGFPSQSPASIDGSLFSLETYSLSPRRLLDQFFRFVHIKNPMLDEDKVRQIVHRFSFEGPSWDAESCLALLVCAIGSLSSSFDPTESSQIDSQNIAVAQSYFSSAQRRIGIINGTGGVLEAQCHFYSGVYLMTTFQPLRAWRCFTQALASCQEFGCVNRMNDKSTPQSSLTEQVLTAEESVYWTCWKSERELRLVLALRDFSANSLSYPAMYPTPPESMTDDQTTAWYFYLSEISLRRLEYRARHEIAEVLRENRTGILDNLAKCTKTLEELANEWFQSLPMVMSLQTPQEEDSVLKFILRGQYMDLWELVYWPWLQTYFDLQIRSHYCEQYLAKAFQTAIDRININKPGFRHRHHGTWFMLRACTCSALVLLVAHHTSRTTQFLPQGWQNAVRDVMELLRYWEHKAPDVADRLQIIEDLAQNIDW